MVEHIVLFKVRVETPPQAVAAMTDGAKGLKSRVPGIVDLSFGPKFSDRNKGFTHGLVVRFQDRAALDGYIPHPAHREVVEKLIRPITEDVLVVDYEI
jgi:stress responsive alpha/beta barrel protein